VEHPSKLREAEGELTVDLPAVAANNEDEQPIVFNFADEPVVADAVFPELPEPRPVQGLSDAAGVVQGSEAFAI